MSTMWISEFLFLYFQCVEISSKQETELVKTRQYPEEKTLNISCVSPSQIQIQNISVQEEEATCGPNQCVLNFNDTKTIKDNCNGENTCLVDYNIASACLWEFRYVNLSYICKHELPGYVLNVLSYAGKNGTARIDTDGEFKEPICLSLWYQIYADSYDCSLSIYKISDKNQNLLFHADGNSTSFSEWINISIDVDGQGPFKITLEADFKHRNSGAIRNILIDDTSIAYRPCQGQQVHSACHELNKPIEIECETQYLASKIELSLEPENPTSHLKNCPAESLQNEINSFCRNSHKTDKCKFSVLNFTSGYDDCYISSKNMSVSFQCNNNSQTTMNMEISTDSQIQFEAIAAGVGGGVLIIIIVGVVIYRVRRSKTGPDNSNKAYDKNQYDYASQQHITSSESSNHNRNKQNNSNSNTQKQVLVFPNGQQSAGLYNMTDDGTYHVSSNSKHRENQNDINLYSHTSNNGTYDVSRNNEKREYQNDDNIYSQKADDVYDSAGHHKLPDRGEETYDHFFGQLTEDEYHTTTRT
ncbi:uncharacterized protein [Mytilus edulis]|uniref:uncharacterized protein isoform X2 n=1 Tax=Mytilus edulis TaxID=6550 RepID=UPI0039F03E83